MEHLREYTYLKTTRSMCRKCKQIVNARIVIQNNKVYQENICINCGNSCALIADDYHWYFDQFAYSFKRNPPKKTHMPHKKGCPYDCGICSWHESQPTLPIFSITNACNLK